MDTSEHCNFFIVVTLFTTEPVAAAPVAAAAPAQQQPTKVVIPFPEESENITRWIVDQSFRKEQERLKIPFGEWSSFWKTMEES